MVKGRNYSKVDGFDKTLSRFKGKKHKSIVSNLLRNNDKVTKNNYISAYDPATRQFVSGSLKEVSIALNVSASTLSKRMKKGDKMEMTPVKGFVIGRHTNIDTLLKYREEVNKEDKITVKEKPILGGNDYVDLLKENVKLKNAGKHENKFYNTNESRFKLEIGEEMTIEDLYKIFEDSINQVKQADNVVAGRDKMRLVIEDASLQHGAISTAVLDAGDITPELIMNLVEGAIESNEDFIISEDTNITITTIDGTYHQEKQKKKNKKYKGLVDEDIDENEAEEIANTEYQEPQTIADNCYEGENVNIHKLNTSMKKSIVQIKNTDSLCVPRAIATGYFMALSKINPTDDELRKNYDNAKRGRKIQEEKATEFVSQYEELMGEMYDGNGFSVDDLEVFEDITGLSITAIDGDKMMNVVYPKLKSGDVYKPPENDDETIYLYLHTENGVPHCDLINNGRVAGFFGRHYFCHKCKKCYEKKDCHKCQYSCKMCCKSGCPTISEDKSKIKYTIHCEDCDRYFPNQTCFNNHKYTTTSKNGKVSKSVCDRVWKCQQCKKVMDRKNQPPETHICGDYHCCNCKKIVRKDHQCYMLPRKINEAGDKYIYFDFECDISGAEHEVMYAISMYQHSPDPKTHENINDWCQWAFDKNHKEYTFIAHNGMGYDYRFIVKWIYENTHYEPFIIWGGQKIIYMSVKELKIRFIDSLSFLTMPLSEFPKTFGEKELKKGFFPHWFNKRENRKYIGEMPPISDFKPERMKEDKYKEFMDWYQEKVKNDYVWNEEKEMREYCISDVDILRKCCIKFRKLYLDIANIDPFTYLTIASVCMAIFKYYYIDETYPTRTEEMNELKKMVGNPSKLKGKKLEIWNDAVSSYEKDTIDTIFSEKKIAIFAYEDVEWMRQAFFGGRTNATKLIYNFQKGEEGVYSDITSLYPTVNYYDIYPKGHPIIYKEEDITDIHYKKLLNKEYLGFFDVDVIPPKRLYHPVLPTKGEKLIFDLLEKRGIWCSNEVYVALDMGYKIKKIYEIRHFEEGTKSLFKGYVRKFLKIKQEASGYPKWVDEPENPQNDIPKGYTREEMLSITEEDRKDLYIHLYEKGQGILLDKTKIVYNPGLRAIAKLCLNSLWGKFGQRTNMGRCEIVSSKDQFFDILYNPTYEKINWIDIAEDKVQISYSIKDEYVENDFNTNMAIACFTTSRARMRLYEEALKVLDRQVLYFDTDSVVYTYNPKDENHIKLKNGDYLGEWTDELDGARMVGAFVSGGPKNYSYELLSYIDKLDEKGNVVKDKDGNIIKIPKTKYKVKVKGFTLNKETSGLINHNSMKDLIESSLFSGEDEKIIANWHGIKRVANNGLENISMEKKYGLCYTKRQILPADEYDNYDTRPFGWEYSEEERKKYNMG